MAVPQLPPVLTAQQAADYLGISGRELYLLLKADQDSHCFYHVVCLTCLTSSD